MHVNLELAEKINVFIELSETMDSLHADTSDDHVLNSSTRDGRPTYDHSHVRIISMTNSSFKMGFNYSF